jgi:hypothetical protein
MRWLVVLALVVGCVPLAVAAPENGHAPPRSFEISSHPHVWHSPARMTAAGTHVIATRVAPSGAGPAGIRFEPETGATSPMDELAAQIAARRQALAQVPVQVRADGSRHAVVGGLIRGYTVATIGADGKLNETCVHTEAQAKALVGTPAKTAAGASSQPADPACPKER